MPSSATSGVMSANAGARRRGTRQPPQRWSSSARTGGGSRKQPVLDGIDAVAPQFLFGGSDQVDRRLPRQAEVGRVQPYLGIGVGIFDVLQQFGRGIV